MANYTKRDESNAETLQMAETWTPKRWNPPRCHCGEPASFEVNRWPKIDFYCTKHLPADALGK